MLYVYSYLHMYYVLCTSYLPTIPEFRGSYLSIYIYKHLLHALFYNEYMHLQIIALCTWIPNDCLTWSAMLAEVLSHGVVVSHTLWAPSRLEVTSSEAWGEREGGGAEEQDLLCCFFASLIQRIKSDQLPKGGVLVVL